MNSDNIGDYKIYDGNGRPFDRTRRYFNRYQPTMRHNLEVRSIKPCKYKTCGGIVNYHPFAYCYFEYCGDDGRITRHSGRFEGEYIAKNIFGFPQLIPVDEGITLDFKYCQSGAYRDAVLELWKKENPGALKEAQDAEAEERRRIRALLGEPISPQAQMHKERSQRMTWLEFKRKTEEATSRLTSEVIPITFLHGDTEINPDDIIVCCGVTGDELELIIKLKKGGSPCK